MDADDPVIDPVPTEGSVTTVTRRRVVVGVLVAVGLVAAGLVLVISPDGSEGAADDATSTVETSRRTTIATTTSTERVVRTSSTTIAPTTAPPTQTTTAPADEPPAVPPPQDADDPSVVARPVPDAQPTETVPPAPAPPWGWSRRTTASGHLSTDVACADGLDAGSLDRFMSARIGPVMGWDYQHVYPLGGDRYLWLFQDTFIDQSGAATTLGQSSFVHNAALVQEGRCFRLLHGGTAERPRPFESGTGSQTLSTWFWPMGGELHGGELHVYWVKMVKDAPDPTPPDGLGWHPAETWLATYDAQTLRRLAFQPAANAGVTPVYGYAVASDATHTYLFGNTFEQNLSREGGYWNGPHSATRMYLSRVPRGQMLATPEYRSADGWSTDPGASVPILQRHWAEFPMQPRLISGQWVGVAAVNGYWGDEYSVDVARNPWGPWSTVESRPLAPRGGDPLRNTYHAHLMPWRDLAGNLVVSVSNNARNMLRDAWPNPSMYRPMVFASGWSTPPPPTTTPPATTPPVTAAPTTRPTTPATTAAPATTAPPTTARPTTSTTVRPTTTSPSTSTTSTTVAPSTSSTTTTSAGATTTAAPR